MIIKLQNYFFAIRPVYKYRILVCAAFRGTYLDFKDKADEQNHQNIVENAERL
jgi:cytochrome bd-type quinol oxidase subunit 2